MSSRIECHKTKTKIITRTDHKLHRKSSESIKLEPNTCSWCKCRGKNVCKSRNLALLLIAWQGGASFYSPSLSVVLLNLSKSELLSTLKWKVLYQQIFTPKVLVGSAVISKGRKSDSLTVTVRVVKGHQPSREPSLTNTNKWYAIDTNFISLYVQN